MGGVKAPPLKMIELPKSTENEKVKPLNRSEAYKLLKEIFSQRYGQASLLGVISYDSGDLKLGVIGTSQIIEIKNLPITGLTLGDLIYVNASGDWVRLAGNTTTTKKYLSQTGTGSASATPAWSQPTQNEIINLTTSSSPTFVTTKLSSLTDGKIPYHVDDATGLSDGPVKTDVDSAVSLKHAAVTLGTANGLSLSTQELSLSAATSSAAGAATASQIAKLDGIEALADVTDATNVAAAGAVMESDTTTASMSFVIDEDTMASNLDTKVPTQQSVKAYVDTQVGEFIGLFEIDINGDLEPVTDSVTDQYYELDGSDDIMPKAA